MPAVATILYIEDNLENRLLVKRVLQAEGHRVLEASDGPAGLKLAEAHRPDLILMDINLPEVDGYSMTARFKAMPHLARIPVVALTANVMKGDRERSLAAGCDGYIQKPIDVDQLPRQIARLLAAASLSLSGVEASAGADEAREPEAVLGTTA